MSAMTDWANAQYELRVDYEPDEDGDFMAHVYVDGRHAKCKLAQDRAVAIERAAAWVEWRRTHADGHETIAL